MSEKIKKLISFTLMLVMIMSTFSIGEINASAGSVIENAISWALAIANDNSHGYSQLSNRRWGNPDYDCSSFVITAFKNAGCNVGSATYTGNMRSVFVNAGFTWIPKSQINLSNSSQLQRGDILLNEKNHTEIYIGNNQRVGAHSGTYDIYDRNAPGDNNGKEICVYNYSNSSNWDGILRYKEEINPPTNVYLDKNQSWYDIQDTITLYPHADGATYYWLSVYKGDNHIVDTCIYGEYSFSASTWGYGNYYAWITAGNSAGGTDSEGISFSVIGGATYSNVYTSKPIYDIDDTVSITVVTVFAKGQCLGIDKEGVGRVFTENTDSTFTCPASNLGIGKYYAYFSVYNGSGGVDTKKVEFYIAERKNLGDEFYAKIKNTSSEKFLTAVENNVEGKNINCDKQQVWHFIHQSDNSYKILNCYDNRAMDVDNYGDSGSGTNVQVYHDWGATAQRFYVYEVFGAYYIKSVCCDMVLDLSQTTFNLEVWGAGQDWAPQKFDIDKIEQSEIGVHKYTDKIVAPTINNDGYTEHICSICGYSYKDSYTHLDDLKSEDYNISLSSNNYTYDGKAKTPTVTVKNDTATLVKDTDYTVKYTNNINAGTATVTVTGIGNYTGTLTKNFTINKASQTLSAEIVSNTLSVGKTSKITANGQGTISYTSNNKKVATVNSSGVVTGISTGTAEITVTASGNSNYKSASKTITVTVNKQSIVDDKFEVSLSSNSYTYDGKAKTPTVTVKNDTATLVKDTDYTVEYSNNKNAGTATVTVKGIGNYTGTLTKNFTINKASQILSAEIVSNMLNVGETSKIIANGQGTISYTSNNTKVATVNSSGVVTGISTGTAEITVTASGNSNYKSASKTITVTVEKSCLLGDVNGDGKIDIDDVTETQKYVANMLSFTEEQQKVADVTNDGKINIDDVTTLQKYIAGIITELG